MKRRYTKRKHRNGKRPERKGNIKIDLQDLPDPDDVFSIVRVYAQAKVDHWRQRPDIPYLSGFNYDSRKWNEVHEKYMREEREWDKAHNRIEILHKKYWDAYIWLLNYEQVNPADLAMDVISDVQPEAPIFFYIEPFCDQCKRKNRCPLMKLEWLERSDRCKKLIAAYEKHCEEIDNGSFERPMDLTKDYTHSLSKAWEIPLS